MHSNQIMVVTIVAIVMIASVIRAGISGGHRRSRRRNAEDEAEKQRENQLLRDEVKQLKERLAVLERITVEKEGSLEREIERLRDR